MDKYNEREGERRERKEREREARKERHNLSYQLRITMPQ